MNEDLIFDLIKDCTKTFNEIKKKHNEDLNTTLVNCLNNLNSLKENLSKKSTENIDENLLSISSSFIESASQIITLKYNKYFLNLLILLKKFLEYNILSKEKSKNVIELLKRFYNNSKTNDECQNKVIEILQTLLFTSFFEIKFDILSSIYILILKSFNNANHSKNIDFKNPIRLILSTLTEKVYSSNNFELILQTTYLIFSWYDLSLKKKMENLNKKSSNENNNLNEGDNNTKNELNEDIDDNLKEEINSILSQKKNNIYIQCLSLELLSQGFTIMNNSKKGEEKKDQLDMNFLDNYLKNKILKDIIISIDNIKKSNSVSEEELNYLHYLKLCRFIKIILLNYNINYDIIQSILDLITENKNKVTWKINLSFEFLSNIITNYELLGKIYIYKKDLINSIFSCVKDFVTYIESLKDEKDNKKTESIISTFMRKKEIDSNKIYLEGDLIEVLKEHNKKYYKHLISDCLQNMIDTLLKVDDIESNEKKDNKISQKEIFEILGDNVKDIICNLLYSEFQKINNETNLKDDCEIKIYINYIQKMMELFNNLKIYEKRDEYLKFLCNLALEFSDEKNEDKNIFIALNILDISKSTNLLNKESYILILKTLQVFNRKYNFMNLNEYSFNDLDKIFKEINEYYKKYNKNDIEEIPIHYIENKKNIIKIKNEKEEDEDEEKKEELKIEINNNIKEEEIKEVEEEKENEDDKKIEEDKEENKKEDEIKDNIDNNKNEKIEKEKEKEKEKKKKDKKKDKEKKEKEKDKEKKDKEKEKDKKEKEKEKEKEKDKNKEKDNKKSKDKKDNNKKENEKINSINNSFGYEMRVKLIEGINSMFIDSKNLDLESLKYVFEALSSCIESSIKKHLDDMTKKNEVNEKDKETKKKDTSSKDNKNTSNIDNEDLETIFNYRINFYFSKILTITLLNIDKIYILFDPFVSIINQFTDNKIKVDFSIDIICSLIPEILLRHEKIELNIKKNLNDENKIWINEKWQKLLFAPLLNILSQSNLYGLIKEKIFLDLNKIIQQCGNYIDLYGWESIIQLCTILCNYDIENTFLAVKQILNDYVLYITLFNILPLMKLLQLFISDEHDKNTSFSAVELFWSCANIIDDFKLEKRKINEKDKPKFDELLKNKEIKNYCDEIYYKLFSYLISINNDTRLEVRKSGLNVFTEIFVSKMSSINSDECLKIINDIFFKIFSSNIDKYISNKKDNEQEQALEITLFDIIKILKEYFKVNENENELFDNYLKKIIEIIPKGSILLNTDILKTTLEIKTSKNENMPIIATKLDVYFKILSLMKDYIKSLELFEFESNKVSTYKLFSSILNYLNSIFCDDKNKEIYTDDNLKNVFNILDTLFESVYSVEPKLLEMKPRKIVDFEKDIFEFLEKIPVQNNIIYNYIIGKISYDFKNPHNEAISRNALECIQNIICNIENNKNNFGLKKEEKELFEKIIEKLKEIINLRNKNEIVESLISTCPDKDNLKEDLVFDKYMSIFIKIVEQICNNFSKYKETIDDEMNEEKKEMINNICEIFSLILDLFETIFKQSINGFQEIDKSYLIIITEIYQKMEIEIVNFIINKLLFYILFILGDEDQDIFKKIEEKIIKVIKLSCDISYNSNNNSPPNSLNQVCINELFEVCRYKSNEEILSKIKDDKIKIDKDKYIKNQIKIGKICTHLLIQKLIDLLKAFREDEIKSGDMPLSRTRIQEISTLLQNAKTLDVFPNINSIEKDEKEEIKNEEITVYDVVSKGKKIHLFYLQPILIDFIDTKEKDIKNLVKEIFEEITNIIGMPKLNDFGK